MSDRFKLQEPLNSEERYLYGINVRLSILIEQLSSIVEVMSKQNNVAVESKVEKLETVIDKTDDALVVEKKPRNTKKTKK